MWKIGLLFFLVSIAEWQSGVLAQLRPPPKVTLPGGGNLIGSYMFSSNKKIVHAFRGIPYAKPPLGKLRFAAPEPLGPWYGDRIADHDGQPCPQQDHFGLDKTFFGSEDCLYLNVYTPQKRSQNASMSVMVFFHGGAFAYGGSSSDIYGPQRLIDNSIVLVTSNYRLGPLGFLTTGTNDAPGNNGLKDQVMVLKWVHENIKSFGGNPRDITLFGHSAGAASVGYHLVSPLSKGLFNKAIMQSGNSFDPWAIIDTSTATDRTRRIAETLNCTEGDRIDRFAEVLKCLRRRTAQDIILTTEDFYIIEGEPMNVFGPILEPDLPGAFLTKHPKNISDSYGSNIPVMIGVTSDEGVFKSAPILYSYKKEFEHNFKELLPFMLIYEDIPMTSQDEITGKIDEFYYKGSHKWSRKKHQNLTDMFSDRLFYSGMDNFLRHRLSKNGSSTYVYVFDHKSPKSLSQLYGGGPSYYGVAHGDELPFLFPLGQDHLKGDKYDNKMRWAMPRLWTDFAKTGNPTPKKSPIKRTWTAADKFPLTFARLGGSGASKWSTDDHNKINDERLKVDEKKKETKIEKNVKIRDLAAQPNKVAATVAPTARKSKKHHSKSKKSKNSKGSKRDYFPIIENEVTFLEKRMEFWRNLNAFIAKIRADMPRTGEYEDEEATENGANA